jgi:hypothetical protein
MKCKQVLDNERDELADDFSFLSAEAPSEPISLQDARETITFDCGNDNPLEQKKIDCMVGMI